MSEEYGEGVEFQLDNVEFDDTRKPLWNAICAALDIIFDKPDSAEARTSQVILRSGEPIWRVPVQDRHEDQDWSIFWAPTEQGPLILYVGPWPPLS